MREGKIILLATMRLLVLLLSFGVVHSAIRKTGTTIAGVVYRDGVVLGADQRATEGSLIADKNCTKIHKLCDNIFACGAGTAADAEELCRHASLDLTLMRRREEALGIEKVTHVEEARGVLRRLASGSSLECGLILGGGHRLFTIDGTGATHELTCAVLGSGSYAASATLERAFAEDMDRDAAIEAIREAVSAGISYDTMSGGLVNIVVIDERESSGGTAKISQFVLPASASRH